MLFMLTCVLPLQHGQLCQGNLQIMKKKIPMISCGSNQMRQVEKTGLNEMIQLNQNSWLQPQESL